MYKLEGRQNKVLEVEDSSVKIIRKGGVFASQREKTIPIRNISSVEVKKPGPFVVGFIQFSIAGGKSRDSSFSISGGAFEAVQDENSVVFEGDYNYKIALQVKDYIENYSDKENSQQPQLSVADELVKLKALLDADVISKEDFDNQKSKLLK